MASAWIAALQSHDSAGTLYINTIGVKMDPASGDGLSATDLASACNDWFGTTYKNALPARLTFDSITVRKMPEPTTEEGVFAVGAAGGTSESATFPKELVVVCAWKTDQPGRSGRGHIEFPTPHITGIFSSPESYLTTAVWFTTTLKAFFDALDAGHDWGPGGADGHLSHVVYSRKNAAYYDVKARLARSAPRWLERRQTAP
jgi:hypothetical protein